MMTLRTTAARTRLHFEVWVHHHTAWPLLALVSVLLPVALWALVLHPAQRDVAALASKAAADTVAVNRRLDPSPIAPPASVEPQVARLLADDLEVTQLIERLFVSASHRDLQLRRGEYKAGQLKAIGVDSVQVTLPLQGSYAAIRGWLGEVLSQVAQASIERVVLRRDDPMSARVDADVVLTLWRKMPRSAPPGDDKAAASTGPAQERQQ